MSKLQEYIKELAAKKGLIPIFDGDNLNGDRFAVKLIGRMLVDGEPKNFAAQYFVSETGAASYLRTFTSPA